MIAVKVGCSSAGNWIQTKTNLLRGFAVAAEYEFFRRDSNQGSISLKCKRNRCASAPLIPAIAAGELIYYSVLPHQPKPLRLAAPLRVFVLPPLRLDARLPLSVCLSLAFALDRRSGCATSSAA
jgi:hypothetical protein